MATFQVIVGNIGTVYDGSNYMQAQTTFSNYRKMSKDNYGRAAGEDVVMLHKGEIRMEYRGSLSNEG